MRLELDELLCKKYPKMMVNRSKDMKETCMCWGFECGDGWYNLLNQLMGNIQHHIDWKRKQRIYALRYNRALKQALNGNKNALIRHYTYGEEPTDGTYESVEEAIEEEKFRDIPDTIPQVTLDQVKEKFGTLRFYYTGGDEYIHGMVTMAESMSGVICEECGNPGERKGGGWVRTICDPCEEARERAYALRMAEYELSKTVKRVDV
jgi:hypothetical protein